MTVATAMPENPMPRVAMVIDDDEFMSSLLSDMLYDIGIETVIAAGNGEEALRLFSAMDAPPELLLCDLCMPGMDGIEFLRHIAEQGYRGATVLLSGMDEAVLNAAERLAKSYSVPLLGTLGKPVTRDQLLSMLRRQVDAGGATSPPDGGPVLDVDELRAGLAAGSLRLHFQPQVSLLTGELTGAECLARWHHAERGLLGPQVFVPVAERSGLIHDLTLEVLRQAARQAWSWREAGQSVPLAVNVSMDNLDRLDLPEVFSAVLDECGVEPAAITLEITETRLAQDAVRSLDILTRLRIKGFGLSIDDFGTGYSTMESLKQVPFTELKVDRAFVNGAADDSRARMILDSSVQLARSFNLKLVAEGVETQRDWDLVAGAGCEVAQGYFIARPMPADQFEDWRRGWRTRTHDQTQEAETMHDKPVVLVADDEIFIQELVAEALSTTCHVLVADDGQEALDELGKTSCDLVILDVEMPRLGGYETCRRIKDDPSLADIPVLFLSGHDAIEDRLKGLEVGGEDYMTKPFNLRILEAKVNHLLSLAQQRRDLRNSASFATGTAMTAMTSMSEMGTLLDGLKRYNTCGSYQALADAVLASLTAFDLQGVVQLRPPREVLTYTSRGPASPLDISVIEHLSGMDRIVQFKSRLSITYPGITLLVNNMPLDDSERCGRLRDHLAMLSEAAEARLFGIATMLESERRGDAIARSIRQISGALADIDAAQRATRAATSEEVAGVIAAVEQALLSVALTDGQENFLSNTVREGLEKVMRVQSSEGEMQNQLSAVVAQLRAALE